MVQALVRGLERHGGSVRCGVRVRRLCLDGDRVCGVELSNGELLRADHVVSNVDAWGTAALLPDSAALQWRQQLESTPACGSFLHLHLGFDASGLAPLPLHQVWVGDWQRPIDAEQNTAVVSIPSVLDASMAPEGHHVLHAYTPASEPWSEWAELKRGTPTYRQHKKDRCQLFWSVLERKIPDLRERCQVVMDCLLYTSPSPRDVEESRMPSSA